MKIETILQNLISIKSRSGDEVAIQRYIFGYIKALGHAVEYIEGNVAVKVSGVNHKHALILNSHVDTVDAGDLSKWENNPLKGAVVNGKIFGLGASDEKASVAVSLKLLEIFTKQKPECDVWFTFVINEEVDGSGTASFIQWFKVKQLKKYAKVAAILGEPTDLAKIEIGHKGNMFIKLTVKGDSGHGSQPEKVTDHAITKMFAIVNLLVKENATWAKKYSNPFLGKPSISLTAISAGNQKTPNKFPDSCEAIFDIRTTPEVHLQVIKLISNIVKNYDPKAVVEALYPPASYGYTDSHEDIVKIAREVTGRKTYASPTSNDTCFFTEENIPAIVFGPGNPDVIHQPNEYCTVVNLQKCVDYYIQIIKVYGKL